jgi:hypothetical protein
VAHSAARGFAYLAGMSILTPIPPAQPWYAKAFYNLPLIGWLARDIAFGDSDNIWYFLVIVLTVLVLSVATWGLPALVLIALAYVPVHMGLMVILARP